MCPSVILLEQLQLHWAWQVPNALEPTDILSLKNGSSHDNYWDMFSTMPCKKQSITLPVQHKWKICIWFRKTNDSRALHYGVRARPSWQYRCHPSIWCFLLLISSIFGQTKIKSALKMADSLGTPKVTQHWPNCHFSADIITSPWQRWRMIANGMPFQHHSLQEKLVQENLSLISFWRI